MKNNDIGFTIYVVIVGIVVNLVVRDSLTNNVRHDNLRVTIICTVIIIGSLYLYRYIKYTYNLLKPRRKSPLDEPNKQNRSKGGHKK